MLLETPHLVFDLGFNVSDLVLYDVFLLRCELPRAIVLVKRWSGFEWLVQQRQFGIYTYQLRFAFTLQAMCHETHIGMAGAHLIKSCQHLGQARLHRPQLSRTTCSSNRICSTFRVLSSFASLSERRLSSSVLCFAALSCCFFSTS